MHVVAMNREERLRRKRELYRLCGAEETHQRKEKEGWPEEGRDSMQRCQQNSDSP